MKPLLKTLKSVLKLPKNRLLVLILTIPLCLGIASCIPTKTTALHYQGVLPTPPVLDLHKPTIAIVLGNDQTEITDVIAPYVAFKTASAFNVVLVAEQRLPVALSGNLEVIPHFSFAQLDAALGQDPAVIVVPNIPEIKANEALRLWVQQHGHGQSMVMSVCAGAAMFAATGLIDNQKATTHWGDILWIEPSYPKVHWVRGLRYVDNGKFISTAGVLSGLDGSLHLIARLRGKELAVKVANELHYPTQYLEHPDMKQFDFGFQDALFLLKFMIPWGQPMLGVALFDGIDDMTLSALYDVYSPWLAGQLISVAPQTTITTKHGINLVTQNTPEQWDSSVEILLTAENPQPKWLQGFHVRLTPVREDQFAFDMALKYLTRNYDVLTAEFTAKRLEYRWFLP